MTRLLFVSTDGHAGLPPGEYRDYLDPQYREAYDADVAVQLELAKENRKVMLVEDINCALLYQVLIYLAPVLIGMVDDRVKREVRCIKFDFDNPDAAPATVITSLRFAYDD